MPPYAVPAEHGVAQRIADNESRKVGPYVPAAIRGQIEPRAAAHAVTPPVMPVVPGVPTPLDTAAVQEAPSRIPPYSPLRPTPISVPAMRTPLYIPTVPTPGSAEPIIDEGVIAPDIIEAFANEEPVAEPSDSTDLPWINAFLAATPAVAMPGITPPVSYAVSDDADPFVIEPDAVDAVSESMAEPLVEAEFDEPTVERAYEAPLYTNETLLPADVDDEAEVIAPVEDVPVAELPSEDWPLEDAAHEFHALSQQLETNAPDVSAPAYMFAEPAEPLPLPAWHEDDLLDIMPVRRTGRTPLSTAAVQPTDGELWAERARRAQDDAALLSPMSIEQAAAPDAVGALGSVASAEDAAVALELLARRVRAGDLTLPSYDPRMGESAALVAALAALLGVRLR